MMAEPKTTNNGTNLSTFRQTKSEETCPTKERLTIRLTPAEKEFIAKYADAYDMSESQFIRCIIDYYIGLCGAPAL